MTENPHIRVGNWALQLCLAMSIFLISNTNLHSQIQLDADFGQTGRLTLQLASFNKSVDLKQVGSDQFLLLGDCGNLQSNPNFDLFLMKMDIFGNLDSNFADSGLVKLDFEGLNMSSGREMSILADGRILILGEGFNLSNQADRKAALLMLNPDGSTDSTFGSNGTVIMPFLGTKEYPETLIQDQNGNFLLGGASLEVAHGGSLSPTVARFNSLGAPDSSFGGTGKMVVLPDSLSYALKLSDINHVSGGIIHSLLPLPGGQLLVAGTYSVGGTNIGFMTRLHGNGEIDSTFATHGTLYLNLLSGQNHQIDRLELLPDGSILFSAKSLIVNGMDFMLGRINSDGSNVGTEFIQQGGDDEVNDLIPFNGGMIAIGVGDEKMAISWLIDATVLSQHQEMVIDFDSIHASEAATGVVIDNNLLICAGSVENGVVGESSLAITGLRIGGTVGHEEPETRADFGLYPNPTNGDFILASQVQSSLTIYSMEGHRVFQGEIEIGKNRIELPEACRAGLYHCILTNEQHAANEVSQVTSIPFLLR